MCVENSHKHARAFHSYARNYFRVGSTPRLEVGLSLPGYFRVGERDFCKGYKIRSSWSCFRIEPYTHVGTSGWVDGATFVIHKVKNFRVG